MDEIASPYRLEENDLIGKGMIKTGITNQMRNLQPEFNHLYNELEQQTHNPKNISKITGNRELILAFASLLSLIILTWSLALYCHLKLRLKLQEMKEIQDPELPCQPPPPMPELSCKFNFLEPSLPPKNKDIKFTSGTYDFPISPARRITEAQSNPSDIELEEIIRIEEICLPSCP